MQFAETIQIALQDIPELGVASSSGTISGNGLVAIENYVDQLLPYPLGICKSVMWWDDAAAIPSNVRGNIAVAVDPARGYSNRANWPWQQRWEPILMNPLGVYEIFPGGRRRSVEDYNVPVAYRDGDVILVAPEIAGGSGTLHGVWLALSVLSDTRIIDWTMPAQMFGTTLDAITAGNVGYSLRNLIPGPPVNATKVRAHVSHWYTATTPAQDCKISHISVGVQSGATSSTVAAPVPMPFAGLPEFWMYGDTGLWTDWVDLPVAAGQNLLVTASIFNAGSTNCWSYSPSSGAGCWSSTTDCWNLQNMAGSVTCQPNRTHVIDRVQYR